MLPKKSFFLGVAIGVILLFSFFFSIPDGKLHIVFCDVGQGDAIYIRTPGDADMLIDGGPNDKILTCLSRYMPFYDRTIDVVMLSHPEKDHMAGLVSVLARYKIDYFVIGTVGSDANVYKQLVGEIKDRDIKIKNLYKNDTFNLGGIKFSVLWPEREWVVDNISPRISGAILSKDSSVLGLSTTRKNLNDFSFYLYLQYGSFDALFTGDGDARIQPEILTRVNLPDVEVLKFPHHGSKYGAVDGFLDKVKPEVAVISVGKNPWGHPTKEAIKLLKDRAIMIKRTDLEGNVEVISDGRIWWSK